MESGAKIRTGGTTPEAHPTPLEVARFLQACCVADVPFKATAGLHHPFRHHAESVGCHQFGFENVFMGAALLWHKQVEKELGEVGAADEQARHFEFHPTQVSWKGRTLTLSYTAHCARSLPRTGGAPLTSRWETCAPGACCPQRPRPESIEPPTA